MSAEFADLASYQRGTDLRPYQAAGFDRVMLKATQGRSYISPYFIGWASQAAGLSLPIGAYHFATAADPVPAQATHFLETLAVLPKPPAWLALDCEDPAPVAATVADGQRVAALAAELTARGATGGQVYGSPAWFTAARLVASMLPPGWRHLWLAEYGTAAPSLPAGWTVDQVEAWQYTAAASTPGVPSPCDRSRVIREWLIGDDMEIVDLDKVATAPGKNGFGGTVVAACVAAETAVNAGNRAADAITPLAAEMATIRTAVALLVDSAHPASSTLTDPVGDLVTRVGGLELADAIRVNGALSARMAQLVPSTPAPGGA